ncbi:putative DNA damage-inducible protein 1 [Blattamonas nauphoetae]|uniref:DNA damage-inducible protein 1 n=1 Tax=Blattamonas nauphoetae TaxID=2049346 RepID=A0ABQ9XXR1_9EUKA|nr:putative DNA damage-inducible protein 1 [Blattamonas nauphoetae]
MDQQFQLNVTILGSNQSLIMYAPITATIGHLKNMISSSYHIPYTHIEIYFNNQPQNDFTIISQLSPLRPLPLVVDWNNLFQTHFPGTMTQSSGTTSLSSVGHQNQTPTSDPVAEFLKRKQREQQLAGMLQKDTPSEEPNIDDIPIHEVLPKPILMEPQPFYEQIKKNPHEFEMLTQNRPDLIEPASRGDYEPLRGFLLEVFKLEMKRYLAHQKRKKLVESDPTSERAQEAIMKSIRETALRQNIETAYDEIPESFVQVHMLYMQVEVNGRKVTAFIDTGAQSTIMSQRLCEYCGISHLIDRKRAGIAVGVGTAEIIGKVHAVDMKVGNSYFATSCTILKESSIEFIFGLDNLRRHQCCIDLKAQELRIGDEKIALLSEREIEKAMIGEERGFANFIPTEDAPAQPSSEPQPETPQEAAPSQEYSEENLKALLDMGFDREQAIQALRQTKDDLDAAIELL